jgi:hypothetical protein
MLRDDGSSDMKLANEALPVVAREMAGRIIPAVSRPPTTDTAKNSTNEYRPFPIRTP